MAKRNVVSRTFRSTRKTLGRYLSTGEKSAEATIEQLLEVLGEARASLAKLSGGPRKRKVKRKTAGAKRKKKTKTAASVRRAVKQTAKRSVAKARTAVGKRKTARKAR